MELWFRGFLQRLVYVSLALATAGVVPDSARATEVDVAIVLAADISATMHPYDGRLQKRAYVEAIRHPAFLHAIRSGHHRKIALAYLEWSSSDIQNVIVPMTIVRSEADALAIAETIAKHGSNYMLGHTALGDGLRAAAALFDPAIKATRRVIDISANGTANRGANPTRARNRIGSAGIVINGLPIIAHHSLSEGMALEAYFRDCVISGEDAFQIAVTTPADFTNALLRKLVHEIAGTHPPDTSRLWHASAPVHCQPTADLQP